MIRYLLLFLLPTMLATTETHAQNQRLTPELLWEIGRAGLDCISPDGKLAVYGVQRYDVPKNKSARVLYIVEIQTGATRALTSPDETASDAEFRPDGKKIGFLRDGKLCEVSPEGSAIWQVSDLEINGFHYAPDGKHILFARDVKLDNTAAENNPDLPNTNGRVIDGLFFRHWKTWHDYKYSNIFFAGYAEGKLTTEPVNIMNERFDSPLTPMGGMEQITWSRDSRFIVYTCRKLNGTAEAQSTNSDLYAYELESRKTLNFTADLPGYDLDPVFSPDGRYLAWTSMARAGNENDRTRLMILDTRTQQRQELTEGWDFEANHPQWAADGQSLYFISSENFTYQYYQIGLADKKIRRITEGQHDYQSLKIAGDALIGTRVSMSDPAEVFAVNPKTGIARQLSFVTEDPWKNIAKGKIERRSVKTADGKNLNVWLILPPDFDAKKKYPALLYCQGGPQSALSQFFSYRWNMQLMAANGYIVVAPCRRGMPGSGSAWNDAVSGDWGGGAMQDLLAATDYAAKEPYVDATRMGAVGASFGGYAVYWLAGNHQKRFKAFIAHCGIFNLESFYGETEETWFVNNDLEGAYWKSPKPKSYTQFSPHLYVQNWDTPILVIHNELDFRIPVTQGMQAFTAAQLRGIPSRFLYFPDEGHWVQKAQNSILWQRTFFDWLEKY
ncbi:MAG TPA: S9 family peptidase, partial [Saprospiraceae bacterium]|nr:S9 family peptidase [Saprospiraceae bacterium]